MPSSRDELQKKVGQMLMFGFSGTELNDSVRRMIREQKVGGLILFAANIVEPDQVRQLCRDVQEWNQQVGSEFPILMAIDQEGGGVSRIPWLVEQYPDPVLLANRGLKEAFQFGYGLACELANLGLTVNLAPVLDVLSNPQNTLLARRCLGTEAQAVAALGERLIAGFHAGGVLACGKHFPGHGDVSVDSHHELPVSDCPLETLRQRELIPFVRGIQEAGLSIIMTAHIKYTQLDQEYPATLSPKIIRGLLRQTIGFQGLVITDDLTMGAIAHHFTPKETALAAVRAGVDILLVCHEPDRQIQVWEALLDGYWQDEEIRSAIDQASRRIIGLKAKMAKSALP